MQELLHDVFKVPIPKENLDPKDPDFKYNFNLFPEVLEKKKNHLKENLKSFICYPSIINHQKKMNTELFFRNIPSIIRGKEFNRRQLYDFYSLFKILSMLTAISYKR